MKSCYGHIKGRDASCLNSCACQSNSRRVVNHALERGTSYVFYVYLPTVLEMGTVQFCGNSTRYTKYILP